MICCRYLLFFCLASTPTHVPAQTTAENVRLESLHELDWLIGKWEYCVVASSKYPHVRKTDAAGQHMTQGSPLRVEWLSEGTRLRIRFEGVLPTERIRNIRQLGNNPQWFKNLGPMGQDIVHFRCIETLSFDPAERKTELTLQKDPYRKIHLPLEQQNALEWIFRGEHGVEISLRQISPDAFIHSFVDPYDPSSKFFVWCKRLQAE